MDITEFARLGGKARWKKVSKADRIKAMKLLRKKPRKKVIPQAPKVELDEQAREDYTGL